jgi:hypothetical protein
MPGHTLRCTAKMAPVRRAKAWIGICILLVAPTPSRAGDTETRTFAIAVDGKSAGTMQMTIREKDATCQTVEVHARVDVRVFFVRYTYKYDGTEEWKQGRLMQLQSSTNDDGAPMSVTASAQGDELHVRSREREENVRWDVWTTSYWRLPAPRFRNQGVPLLDADTGKYLEGSLALVGNETLRVGGRSVNCAHYHVSARGIDVNVWYDDRERLVRQTSKEQGQNTIFTLRSIGP